MSRTTIAIDNGTTGSIAIMGPDGVFFDEIPTKEFLMGKSGKVVRRINVQELATMFEQRLPASAGAYCDAYVERPFTGSAMMINTTVLSARAHEAVLIVLEHFSIGTQTVDSRAWQKAILGNVTGSSELKKASKLRGMQMFPAHAKAIKDHGDADSLLMAQYYHNLNQS
jgi:hypothetical protein